MSVPFAMIANTVADGAITTEKLADGAVTQAKLGADVSVVSAFVQKGLGGATASYNVPFDQCSNGYVSETATEITLDQKSLVIIEFFSRLHEDDGDWYFNVVRGTPPSLAYVPLMGFNSAGAKDIAPFLIQGAEILDPGTYVYGVCVHATTNLSLLGGGFTIYAFPTDIE